MPSTKKTPLQPQLQPPGPPPGLSGSISWAPVILATLFGLLIASAAGTHIALVGVMVPIVVAIAWSSPRSLLLLLVVWTTELGLMRRLTPSGGSVGFSGDPLLIIGPVIIICLVFTTASMTDAFTRRTRLATIILVFNALALVEVVNPGQGSLLTGLGGLLFILVPVMAFWVGRGMVDDELMTQVVWTIAILGALTAAYGLFQQFHGFPSWDETWIHSKSYSALTVGGQAIRSFGTMSSGQEYAGYLCLALMAWIALLTKKTRLPRIFHLAIIVMVGTAIFYESERTAAILAILGLAVVAGAWRRLAPITLVLVSILSIVALVFGLGALIGNSSGSGGGPKDTAQVLAQHQISGLTDPTGQGSSLNGHIHATDKGIIQGLTSPAGKGVGSVTLAANRYNSGSNKDLNGSTEYDPGNMGVAFGIGGVILYFLILVFGLGTVYRVALRRHDFIGLFVLGVMVVSLFDWFNGDLYAVTWLVWLCLGVADGDEMRAADAPGSLPPTDTSFDAPEAVTTPDAPRQVRRWLDPSP